MEPMLRFKADDGSDFPDWEEMTLGELFYISAGGDIDKNNCAVKQSKDYPYPIYANALVNGGLYGYTNYYKIDGDTFTVTGRGDVGHAVARHCKYVPIVRLLVCRPNMDDDVDFFAEQINYTRIFIESTGVPQLTAPQLSKTKVKRPSLPEQRKIADLLSAVDDVIAAQEAEVAAWEKRKKGVMQKLFSQEVRFKADDGSDFPDWEEKTLGDICMYERQRSEGANFVGTENMLKDFGGVTFDNSNADGSGTLYHPGDTLMSNIRPYLKKAWLADRKGTCSTDVLVFHPTSVEPGYLYWLIASDAFVRYVMSAAKGSKMPRGDKKHIMEMPLLLPNKDEQRKIDDCLSSLNDVIIKAKNELAKWQELKKGLLQQMFV
jgi:type I restriction enzyme S subunit